MNFKHKIKFLLAQKKGSVVDLSEDSKPIVKKKELLKIDKSMPFSMYLKRRMVYLEDLVEAEEDEEKRIAMDKEYDLLDRAQKLK